MARGRRQATNIKTVAQVAPPTRPFGRWVRRMSHPSGSSRPPPTEPALCLARRTTSADSPSHVRFHANRRAQGGDAARSSGRLFGTALGGWTRICTPRTACRLGEMGTGGGWEEDGTKMGGGRDEDGTRMG
ncbi:hypothetical protein B2J93_2055 [Marssonina coronariae]|uniref:Uncharacterized protein n=1 Tax=Diplocarpon coronariae TaxID=2795749 RepID=A0A218ZHP8_9HELO|nr:hypothetical protein B2J93_2055 [Marssonina coronariae]